MWHIDFFFCRICKNDDNKVIIVLNSCMRIIFDTASMTHDQTWSRDLQLWCHKVQRFTRSLLPNHRIRIPFPCKWLWRCVSAQHLGCLHIFKKFWHFLLVLKKTWQQPGIYGNRSDLWDKQEVKIPKSNSKIYVKSSCK